MNLHINHKIERFCVAGISYQKANTHIRTFFSLDHATQEKMITEAFNLGIGGVVVLNTCNRVEIYGHTAHPQVLLDIWLKQCPEAHEAMFHAYGYMLTGKDAINHTFKVGAGLDSQIIGDFEIAGQMKQALAFSQKRGMVGPMLDRIFNFVSQASKKVKNHTALSSGTVSVSFAAIEWLQQELKGKPASILVVGAGKFGANVMKNLLHYLPACKVAISNRTMEKAKEIAANLPVEIIPFSSVSEKADSFDAIITCTHAPDPFIRAEYFSSPKKRLLIDLSVPANIHENVKELENVHLVNVDDISVMLDNTISRRMADVPKAEAIIAEHTDAFYVWLGTFQHAPAIHDMKRKLQLWSGNHNKSGISEPGITTFGANAGGYEENIHAAVSNLMVNLKTRREKGCHMIAAYHDFFTLQNNIGLP
jgi:glutamyl-tRNA reductase